MGNPAESKPPLVSILIPQLPMFSLWTAYLASKCPAFLLNLRFHGKLLLNSDKLECFLWSSFITFPLRVRNFICVLRNFSNENAVYIWRNKNGPIFLYFPRRKSLVVLGYLTGHIEICLFVLQFRTKNFKAEQS